MKIYEYIVRIKDQSTDKLNRLASSFSGSATKADRLSGATDKLSNSFSNLGNQWSQSISLGSMLTRVLGPAALGAALMFGATKASALAREAEQTNIAFEVMMGSADKAHRMVGEITQLANVTPFTRNELLDSARLMMNFGIASERILPNLKMLGDISGGNANKMHMMTLAFSQSAAAGRLMGQDLLQMINAGFNPLQEISKKTGMSMAILKKKMEDGAISTKMVEAAFKSATSEGGLFFGMMDRQSQTFEGRLSTLRDKMEIWATDIGQKLNSAFSPILDKIISGLDRLTDRAGSVKNESDKEISNIRKLATELKPLIDRFDELRKKKDQGLTIPELMEYGQGFAKLSSELPGAAIFDRSGKKVDFDISTGRGLINNEINKFNSETNSKLEDLKTQLSAADRMVRNSQNSLLFYKDGDAAKLRINEELGNANKDRNRILSLIDEVKSSRANAFRKLSSETSQKNPFDDLLNGKVDHGEEVKKGINGITGGGKQAVNVTINLQSLVAEQNISTTTMRESVQEIERMVTEALLRVVNSANYAATQ